MSEYDDLLTEAYRGEVFGRAFFGALADAQPDDVQREKLRALQRVEAQTASHLRPLVDEAGIDAGDSASEAEGVEMAGGMGQLAWTGFLEGLRGALPSFLSKFERLQAIGGHEEILADLVAHEQAIDRFAELELSGQSAEALDGLRRHLDPPGSAADVTRALRSNR